MSVKFTGHLAQVKEGWSEAGRKCRLVSEPVEHDGLKWIGVIWEDDPSEEGLDWFKLHALETIDRKRQVR